MFQKTIENCRLKNAEPARLFAKIKEQRLEEKPTEQIYGVPMIQSDASDHEDEEFQYLKDIKIRLDAFKQQKARQVVKIYRSSKQSVENIVAMLKNQLSYQALCIIDSKYKRSAEKQLKQQKEGGSTLPNSEERQGQIETPGFELEATNGKPVDLDIDLREFTLGQKEDDTSNERLNCLNEEIQFVTEFQTNAHKSTKNIKNKIMMRKQ